MNQDGYTIGKLFTKTGCITQSMMMQYADGLLSPEDSHTIEHHLVDCALCSDALEGIMLCGTAAFAEMVDEISQKVDAVAAAEEEHGRVIEFRPNINPPMAATQPGATGKRKGFKSFLPLISIAASVMLIVTLGILYIGNGNSRIADRFFAMAQEPHTRSVTVESPVDTLPGIDDAANKLYDEAVTLYEAKDYEKAAVIFDKDSHSKSGLFAGDCYFTLGKYDLAAIRYKKVIDAKQGWEEQAQFNLALTYLKMDEVAQARMLLVKISQDEYHDFYKKSLEVLDEM
jgi:tetratricopeptide (TPR) repeat protein